MKRFLLSAMTLLALGSARAQLPYTLSTQTGQPYTRLAGGTSISSPDIWDEQGYTAPFPAGFNFLLGGAPIASFNIDLSFGVFTGALAGTSNGFIYSEADLADRGNVDGVASRSPIRYEVTGSAPNRIFKAEIANAGFFEEMDIYGTMDDSADIQIWLYETSNVVELRYGPSRITHAADYHPLGGPVIAYVKNANPAVFLFEQGYNLSGSPASPTIDSFDMSLNINPLNSWPANGTVYRFAPIPVGVEKGGSAPLSLRIFPTVAGSELHVESGAAVAEYRMLSAIGAEVQRGRLGKGADVLDIAGLAPGSYLLQVDGPGGRAIRRFTKQ